MSINALLAKIIFDQNPDHEFYLEESFPLDWMKPHLTPHGTILKLNREPVTEITQEMVEKDHAFWRKYSERLTGDWMDYDTPFEDLLNFALKTYAERDLSDFQGNPKFFRDKQAQKSFSKLRSSIAGIYDWRWRNATPDADGNDEVGKTNAQGG